MLIEDCLREDELWQDLIASLKLWNHYQEGTIPLPTPDVLFAVQDHIRNLQLRLGLEL